MSGYCDSSFIREKTSYLKREIGPYVIVDYIWANFIFINCTFMKMKTTSMLNARNIFV